MKLSRRSAGQLRLFFNILDYLLLPPPSFGARSNFFFFFCVWQIQTAPTSAQLQLPGYTGVTKTV